LDYLQWAGNFGSHNASAVPEPGGFGLLVLGVVGWYVSRRGLARTRTERLG
jgi:hypothetical protein